MLSTLPGPARALPACARWWAFEWRRPIERGGRLVGGLIQRPNRRMARVCGPTVWLLRMGVADRGWLSRLGIFRDEPEARPK